MITVKVKLPKTSTLDPKRFAQAVEAGLDKVAEEVRQDFERTTRTWKTRPVFIITRQDGQRVIRTDDRVYRFVSGGTRPHDIYPRRPGGVLRFGVPFSPKTTPRKLDSQAGSRGSQMVTARAVRHPGTKAREFPEAIKEKLERERTLAKVINAELRDAAK